jgi:hypothetical protein
MAVTGNNGFYIQHTAADDGDGTSYPVKVKCAVWHGFTDGAHTLQIKDGAGNIVVPAVACGAAATVIPPIVIPIGRMLTGIETDVLGSGTVVYLLE